MPRKKKENIIQEIEQKNDSIIEIKNEQKIDNKKKEKSFEDKISSYKRHLRRI